MRKHPLIAFFVLAYLLTWWIYPLLKFSPLLGIFGLFGPAIAAIIMAAVTDGKSGVKALLGRVVLWRVGLPWYVIALGLPTILSLATAALAYLVGATESFASARWHRLSSCSSYLSSARSWAGVATPCRGCWRSDPP